MQLLFRKTNGISVNKKLVMIEKYKLIEKESLNQIEKLPAIYKNLQYEENEPIVEINTINVKSIRHQTNYFASIRFYKNIEIFKI